MIGRVIGLCSPSNEYVPPLSACAREYVIKDLIMVSRLVLSLYSTKCVSHRLLEEENCVQHNWNHQIKDVSKKDYAWDTTHLWICYSIKRTLPCRLSYIFPCRICFKKLFVARIIFCIIAARPTCWNHFHEMSYMFLQWSAYRANLSLKTYIVHTLKCYHGIEVIRC